MVSAVVVVALAGCGAGTATKTLATTSTVATTTSTTVSPETSSSVATTPTTGGGHTATTTATTRPASRSGTIQLTDKDNGTTVSVTKGTTIVVVLNSTYWKFPNPPNPAVVQQQGAVVVTPAPLGTCIPGGGCGTASMTSTAVGIGSAQISASRTTCGEAMLCTGKAGSYSVQILVTA
jgi:hypothetical protein